MGRPRVLVAGIGNIFLGDDAFGCEVARRLRAGRPRDGVTVRDFGIRGFDLAYALLDGVDYAIFIDALARGGAPGTLYVVEPEPPGHAAPGEEVVGAAVGAHAMSPELVLQLVRAVGGELRCPVRIVGCEPRSFGTDEEPVLSLSEPVAAAVNEAARLVDSLVEAFF